MDEKEEGSQKDKLIGAIGSFRDTDAARDKAKAQLAVVLMEEFATELRQSTERLHSGLVGLGTEIAEHRKELGKAAVSSERVGKALVWATCALVLATVAIVFATIFAGVLIPLAECPK